MASDVEIELKFPIHNSNRVIDFLNQNAEFKHEKRQHDIYYNHPSRDFLADKTDVNEWFRIRIGGDEAEVNYKDFQPHGAKMKTHCIEYETAVSSYDQLSKILDALGFRELIAVKKTRQIWMYDDVEISMDEVDELGSFIELEYKGQMSDVAEVRKYLHEVLRTIGANEGTPASRGYPHMLLISKGLISDSQSNESNET